ncbi:MAG: serine/threonine protein kinase [Candidatus Obscuribacter sp.]|nr:serine/threonine protein kinase [Candidatus Obscuribacter sp.]MBP6594215.1 serine/threonine protein kinase [Candidatus Obscuribacter sp.]
MTIGPEEEQNIWPGAQSRPTQNYQEQASTARVDGMASAEAIFRNRPIQPAGYQVGQIVSGHYEILELVGKGGMSLVYKARHALIDQLRAIKVLVAPNDPGGRALLRFQEEARLAMQLEHANIVRVLEFAYPADGQPFMVMDYIEGRSLEQELALFKRLSAERAIIIANQVIDALEYIHSKGIIHRDLKPANLILLKDTDARGNTQVSGKIKLIDFGIAKKLIDDDEDSRLVTPSGEIVGSPQHMSPEQCAGEPMDERSEIYSLGCILYEMLSGKPPIQGKNALDTLRMQTSVEPRPLASLVESSEAKALAPVVHHCLAKDPDERYQSLSDLRAALKQKQKNKSKVKLFVAATAGGLLVSFASGFMLSQTLKSTSTALPITNGSASQKDASASKITPEISAFVSNMLSSNDNIEAITKYPAMRDNKYRREAESLLQDLNLAATLNSKLSSRLDKLAFDDRDYVELSLQKSIFDLASKRSSEKDSKATKVETERLKTLYLLAAAQSAVWLPDINPHHYFWNTMEAAEKLKDKDPNKGCPSFFCGDFYHSLGDNWDARKAYDHAADAFNEQFGPLALYTAVAHAQKYKCEVDDTSIRKHIARCNRTIDALDDLIARNDHVPLASTSRAELLARMVQAKPAEYTERAKRSIEQGINLLLKDGDNSSMSYARHIVALDLVNGQSGNHDRESLVQALGIYLAHGSIGQAAALARDLSNLYISPDKINVRLRLLNTARDLYQKLRKAGLDQQENMRDCCIALGQVQSDQGSGKYVDAKASLANLAEALTIQKERINAKKDDEFDYKKEHWPLARIEYFKARAYLVQLEPRLAKSSLTAAENALKVNLEFLETYADKEHHKESYLKDKNERLALKNQIEQAMREVK